MRISPINNTNRQNFSSLHNTRIIPKVAPKTIKAMEASVSVFKKIQLETAKQLYNTKFVPSGKDYGEYARTTFVLDKCTGEPVEVVVIPVDINRSNEEYQIVNPNNNMEVIGEYFFSFDKKGKNVVIGERMFSNENKYAGIGIRLHQLAIERMLMKKFSNVEIGSITSAYGFHKKCGFEPIKNIKTYNKTEFQKTLQNYASDLEMSENDVKKLLIYKKQNGLILLDENSSFENIVLYCQKHNMFSDELNYEIGMQLSPEAIQDWLKLINKSPILLGLKLPEVYQPWRMHYPGAY